MSTLSFEAPPTLSGKRVNLIPLELAHAPELFKINHSDIWAYMLSDIKTLEDMEKWVNVAVQQRKDRTALPFVVTLKETNQIVGATRLFDMNLNQKSGEIGHTWYGKDFQRTYVNSECKYILLTYCFEQLEFIRVQLTTSERNEPSQKAIERLGAVREGVRRNGRLLSNGVAENAIVYSITNDDWKAVKQGLEEKEAYYLSKRS